MYKRFRRFGSTVYHSLKDAIAYRLFRIRLLRASKPIEPTRRSALVFAPHQDDETLGCGGTIALKRASGVSVKVVFITGGQNGQKIQEGQEPIPAETLTAVRKKEALEALAILGVSPPNVTFLNYMDGGLRQLDAAGRQAIVTKLVRLLADFQPEEVYVTYRADVHPDHETTYQLVFAAIQESKLRVNLLEYPIWSLDQASLNFDQPEFKSLYRLSIGQARETKIRAMTSFYTQCEPVGGLTETFLKRLTSGHEFFFRS